MRPARHHFPGSGHVGGHGRRIAPAGEGGAPTPTPTPIGVIVAEGDSMTSIAPDDFTTAQPTDASGTYANRYRVTADIPFRIRAQHSRVVGTISNLNDGGNSLMGHVAEDMAYEPDLATVRIGANDLAASRTAAEHRSDLTAWYGAIKAERPECRVAWSGPLPYNPAWDGEPNPQYDNFTAQRALLMADARDPEVWGQWADYYMPLGDNPDFADVTLAPDLFEDAVHLDTLGDATEAPAYKAFVDTIRDASRVNSTQVYASVFPAAETGLAASTRIRRRIILAGIAHKGTNVTVSVSGDGNPLVRHGAQGTWDDSVSLFSYNGDVVDLEFDTAATGGSQTIEITINGQTVERTFATAEESLYTAKFDSAKKSPNSYLADNDLTFYGSNFGSNYPVRGGGDTALTQPTGYVEFTSDTSTNDWRAHLIGVVNSSYSFSTAGIGLGQQAGGFAFHAGGIYYAGSGIPQNLPGSSWEADGTVVGMLIHRASGNAWLRTPNGWFPEEPTFDDDEDRTILTGTGIPTGLTEFFFAAGQQDDSQITVNSGASPFIYELPDNVEPGWR